MTNLLTQSVAFISLGFDAEAEENVEINDPQLKTLISQIRTNLSNKHGGKNGNIYIGSIDSSLVPSQEEFAALDVSEIASFHLTHRHAPVCIAAAVELERYYHIKNHKAIYIYVYMYDLISHSIFFFSVPI